MQRRSNHPAAMHGHSPGVFVKDKAVPEVAERLKKAKDADAVLFDFGNDYGSREFVEQEVNELLYKLQTPTLSFSAVISGRSKLAGGGPGKRLFAGWKYSRDEIFELSSQEEMLKEVNRLIQKQHL